MRPASQSGNGTVRLLVLLFGVPVTIRDGDVSYRAVRGLNPLCCRLGRP